MIDVTSRISEVLCIIMVIAQTCVRAVSRSTVWTDIRSVDNMIHYVHLVGTMWTCVRLEGTVRTYVCTVTILCREILLVPNSLPDPGGGGTASLKVGTHCQTTALVFFGLSAPQFSLTTPYFLG